MPDLLVHWHLKSVSVLINKSKIIRIVNQIRSRLFNASSVSVYLILFRKAMTRFLAKTELALISFEPVSFEFLN